MPLDMTRAPASSCGDGTAPYTVCPRHTLVAGNSPLDWELEVPAERFLAVTAARLLPAEVCNVEGHAFDFRQARPIGSTEIDYAFTGIRFDTTGMARAILPDEQSGTGLAMAWDPTCRWLQIHTADKPPPALNRGGLAVEPMTCPPNAFTFPAAPARCCGKDLSSGPAL